MTANSTKTFYMTMAVGLLSLLWSCSEVPETLGPSRAESALDSAWQVRDSDPERALEMAHAAQKLVGKGDSLWCLSCMRKAHAFARLNQADSALHQWSLAIGSCQTLGVAALNELASQMIHSGVYGPVRELLQAGMREAGKQKDTVSLVQFYQTAASLYYMEDQMDSLTFFAREANRLANKFNLPGSQGRALTTLSVAFGEAGQTDSALSYARKAQAVLLESGDRKSQADALSNIGYAFELAEATDSALFYYHQALEKAKDLSYFDLAHQVKLNLSDVYQTKGMLPLALQQLYEANSLKDSIAQAGLSEQLQELQVRYKTLEKDRQLQLVTQQQRVTRLQRNGLLVLSALVALAMVLSVLYFVQRSRFQKRVAQSEIHRLKKEQEVMGLQGILTAQEEERQRIARDLHDSIGTLLSTARIQMSRVEVELQKMAEIDLVKNTEEIIARASTEVRRLAHNMMPGVLMELGLF